MTMSAVMIRVVVALLLLGATVWGSLALFFAGPGTQGVNAGLATGSVAGSAILLYYVRPWQRALGIWSVLFAFLLFWWSGISPSNQRDWAPDVAKLPFGEIDGQKLTLHNVRNFAYRSETDFTTRYEDRTYDLSTLRGLSLFMSYWGSPYIAHTILSWEFENAAPLAISIETRKERTEEYSAVKGFFKQYELFYVAADERDLIRLRTNYRGEQVYLYRLKTTPERARAILLDYVATMNDLVDHPQFYNALTHNCTTTIEIHVKHVNPEASVRDWRLLVNGYADEMLYERGIVDTSLPFAEFKARSLINAKAKAADQDVSFSQRIREGIPSHPAARRILRERSGNETRILFLLVCYYGNACCCDGGEHESPWHEERQKRNSWPCRV